MERRVKIVNLNFWMGKLESSLRFLLRERTDNCIITLQEVEEKDLSVLERELSGMHAVYGPMHLVGKRQVPDNRLSVAVFSDRPLRDPFCKHYATFNLDKPHDWWRSGKPLICALLGGSYRLDNTSLCVATTHFTWNGGPLIDDEQRRSIPKLLKAMRQFEVDVLACDLNSMRQMTDGSEPEIWAQLAAHYRDNIPDHVVTTLDPRHPATIAGEFVVVDGLFSSSNVLVTDVDLHHGVSDHCGITAQLHVPKG